MVGEKTALSSLDAVETTTVAFARNLSTNRWQNHRPWSSCQRRKSPEKCLLRVLETPPGGWAPRCDTRALAKSRTFVKRGGKKKKKKNSISIIFCSRTGWRRKPPTTIPRSPGRVVLRIYSLWPLSCLEGAARRALNPAERLATSVFVTVASVIRRFFRERWRHERFLCCCK